MLPLSIEWPHREIFLMLALVKLDFAGRNHHGNGLDSEPTRGKTFAPNSNALEKRENIGSCSVLNPDKLENNIIFIQFIM